MLSCLGRTFMAVRLTDLTVWPSQTSLLLRRSAAHSLPHFSSSQLLTRKRKANATLCIQSPFSPPNPSGTHSAFNLTRTG
jgi:hypothetical protein